MKQIKPKLCRECKVKFQPVRPLQSFCSIECAIKDARKKTVKKELEKMKDNVKGKERRSYLQDEINLLSRKIDAKFEFDCIDCRRAFTGQQVDACHLISRKKNNTLRYHLHNLHAGHNHCNVYNSSHEHNYKQGLLLRYGRQYLEMVESLPSIYKEIHLNNVEIKEKLKIVRAINRNFNTYKLIDSKSARDLFNKIIGIYK